MANHISHTLPYIVRNARCTIPTEFRDSANALVVPTTPDTEFSLNGAAAADCAEEASAAAKGIITLSGAETNGRMLQLEFKSANGVTGTMDFVIDDPVIHSQGTAQACTSTTLTLEDGAAVRDYSGAMIRTTGGTGGGGTGGANNQARRIISTDYTDDTAIVVTFAALETTGDNTTTYDILYSELFTNARVVDMEGQVAPAGAIDANLVSIEGNTNINGIAIYRYFVADLAQMVGKLVPAAVSGDIIELTAYAQDGVSPVIAWPDVNTATGERVGTGVIT